MSILNVNGLDLTNYMDVDSKTESLDGFSIKPTKRDILIKTIQLLPDAAIDEIFDKMIKTE